MLILAILIIVLMVISGITVYKLGREDGFYDGYCKCADYLINLMENGVDEDV